MGAAACKPCSGRRDSLDSGTDLRKDFKTAEDDLQQASSREQEIFDFQIFHTGSGEDPSQLRSSAQGTAQADPLVSLQTPAPSIKKPETSKVSPGYRAAKFGASIAEIESASLPEMPPAKLEEARPLVEQLRTVDAAWALEAAAQDFQNFVKLAPTEALQEEGFITAARAWHALRDVVLFQLERALDCLGTLPPAASGGHSCPQSSLEDAFKILSDAPAPPHGAKAQRPCMQKGTPNDTKADKKDVLEFAFPLSDDCHVKGSMEFLGGGQVAICWSAERLPFPLAQIIAFIQEIDLFGLVLPFIHSAEMVHQFGSYADRLIRIISKPPIPFISGFEVVAQRLGMDLLETPFAGVALAEFSPVFQQEGGDPHVKSWRGLPEIPRDKKYKTIEAKRVFAIGQPLGADARHTTIHFAGEGEVKVPRALLPNAVLHFVIKTVGQVAYSRVASRLKEFETSPWAERVRGRPDFYDRLEERIASFAKRRNGKEA